LQSLFFVETVKPLDAVTPRYNDLALMMIFSTRRVEVSGHREGVLKFKLLSVAKLQNRWSTSFCLLLPTRRFLTWLS